jgi:hypothetical protein
MMTVLSPPPYATENLSQHQEVCSAPEWEHDAVHAFFEFNFDPETQKRLGAAANARAGSLIGIDHKQLLLRLEQHDVPLPLGPFDAVAMFLHALGAARDDVTTCFCRLSPSAWQQESSETPLPGDSLGARPAAAVLVCCTTVKDFDAFGRVHKVAPTHIHQGSEAPRHATNATKTPFIRASI